MVKRLSRGWKLMMGIFLSLALLAMPIQQICAVDWETYDSESFSIDYPADCEVDDSSLLNL